MLAIRRHPTGFGVEQSHKLLHQELSVADGKGADVLDRRRRAAERVERCGQDCRDPLRDAVIGGESLRDRQLVAPGQRLEAIIPQPLPVAHDAAGQGHQLSAGSATLSSRCQPSCCKVMLWMPTVFIELLSRSGSA